MKIITLTLNPAFDVHCYCENFQPYHESVACVTAKDVGGKGVNISRALSVNGTENLAVVIVGKENGAEFCQALEKDGLTVHAVSVDGRIRENITLHEKSNPETRISFEGFTCNDNILQQLDQILDKVDKNSIITFTGSIPKGMNVVNVLSFLEGLRNKGAKIVIDSRSVSLEALMHFKPWLIKPNQDEAQAYTNRKIENALDAVDIAQKLYQSGIENVMISLGGDGAVLACKEGVFHATTPKINVCSTIGAGDSMLAGFIDATKKGLDKENVLRKAVAFGTAACMQEGTLPPQEKDVVYLEQNILIKKLHD